MGDLLLPAAFLSNNGLFAFEVVLINEKHAGQLGTSTGGSEASNSTVNRFSLNTSDDIIITRPAFVALASTLWISVGASTQIRLTFIDPSNPDDSDQSKRESASSGRLKDESEDNLYGLDTVESILTNFLQEFTLSAIYSRGSTCELEGGILLYGLPGCGKSRLLTILQRKITASKLISGNSQLTFITLTPPLAKKLASDSLSTQKQSNTFSSWLSEQILQVTSLNKRQLCLLLPDLDSWINLSPSDVNASEQGTGDESSSNRSASASNGAFGRLFEAIEDCTYSRELQTTCRLCVIATATTADEIFAFPEGRRLFYRRVLVSLPDAQTRYKILLEQIHMRVKANASIPDVQLNDFGLPIIEENTFMSDAKFREQLTLIASRLHGFTPNDLNRLVQVSYASFLSQCVKKSREDIVQGDANCILTSPSDFCAILARESLSYLPINLSQYASPVGPLRWHNIGGYEQLKSLFRSTVQRRLNYAAKPDSDEAKADAALGLRVPKGILLHGPPGCSKTMFVRALATECQLALIAVQASRIFGRYVGDSERNMRRILVQARASAPAILFIDEIDLLLPSRSSSETGASEHVLGEVLTAMDGVEGQSGQVILIAATNRMDKLDSALSRAGRFDLVIEVPPPDAVARAAILRLELSRRALEDPALTKSEWLDWFAQDHLVDYTGAEIVQVVQQAAQLARDSGLSCINQDMVVAAQHECPPVTLARSQLIHPPSTRLMEPVTVESWLHGYCSLLPRTLLFCPLLLVMSVIILVSAYFSMYQ